MKIKCIFSFDDGHTMIETVETANDAEGNEYAPAWLLIDNCAMEHYGIDSKGRYRYRQTKHEPIPASGPLPDMI